MSKIHNIKASFADSYIKRSTGLLFKEKIEPIYIKTRFGIHTFGLKDRIDVIVLDKQHQVVKVKEELAPHTFFFWNPKYKDIIELPRGYIRKQNIKIGDKIKLIKVLDVAKKSR